MNTNFSPGTWAELKIKLRDKYAELTEDDLFYEVGMEQDMLRMVEYKLGKTTDEMNDIIESL
jgi:hypothetical protein